MKIWLYLPLVLLVSGCNPAMRYNSEFAARRISFAEGSKPINDALSAKKINHTEAARRLNELNEQVYGSSLSPSDHLMMDYNLALAVEVDAGRITGPMAAFKFNEKQQELNAANHQRQLMELQTLAAIQPLPAPVVQQAAPPVSFPQFHQTTCNSQRMGDFVTTNCY